MFIVSACLAGLKTRYDGGDSLDEGVRKLVETGMAIPLCPEQLGGLPTLRAPIEFQEGCDGGGVLDGSCLAADAGGGDRSGELLRGARAVLEIALLCGADEAVLKDGSPSCGVTYVHSGGRKVPGRGVTAELLSRNGIEVKTVAAL